MFIFILFHFSVGVIKAKLTLTNDLKEYLLNDNEWKTLSNLCDEVGGLYYTLEMKYIFDAISTDTNIDLEDGITKTRLEKIIENSKKLESELDNISKDKTYFICKCKEGYTTKINSNKGSFCDYKSKYSITASLMELLGLGLGHFYTERYVHGVIKLVFLGFAWWILYLCEKMCDEITLVNAQFMESREYQKISKITITLRILSNSWNILDSLLFYFCVYYDGNNLPLN